MAEEFNIIRLMLAGDKVASAMVVVDLVVKPVDWLLSPRLFGVARKVTESRSFP